MFLFFLFWPRAGWNKYWSTNLWCKYYFKMILQRAFGERVPILHTFFFFHNSVSSGLAECLQKSMSCSSLLLFVRYTLSALHETDTWICWPLAFAPLDKILKCILLPAYTCTVVAHGLAWFWLWCSAFIHTFQWLSFYESILWYLKIPIDYVTPNPSSLCTKELKSLGFPHWLPRVPPPPYPYLALQMVELSIYPTEHCRAAHPSTGCHVKQLQPHLNHRIMMDPPCAPACMSTISSGKLPSPHFSPLFGPNWYSWKDRVALSCSHDPRKRRESQTISFSFSVSLSALSLSAAGRSGAFLAYTHWLHVLNLCQWYTSFGLRSHITQTCGAIYSFLRYFLQKPSLFQWNFVMGCKELVLFREFGS